MPPYKSIGRKPLRHWDAYPALLAAVLAVLVASLIGVSSPQAASGADKSAPTAPQNLHLVGATQWSATVAWTPSSDNVGVVGYRVTFGPPRRAKTTETQYTESGLACGLSYTVEVQAYDHVRNLSQATRAVVSSAPCLDTVGPSAPTSLRQPAVSSSTATLAWDASTDNVAVAGYSVSRGGVAFDQTTETSYVFVGLNCGSTYPVAVRAYDVAGNTSGWAPFYVSTSACGDVTPPSAPSGLVQLDRTQTSISFVWSASTDNVGVAKYAVFRGATQVAETTALTYALPGLTCGTAYTIGAEAVDGAGNRSQRTTATMSTASCTQPPPGGSDTQPPSVPSNLNVGSATTSTIALSWSPSTDNVGVALYDVFRDGVRVSAVTGTSFTYIGLSCGQTYQLGVEAEDAAGNHSGRASVVASTSPCADSSPPSAPGNVVLLSRTSTSVTVSWAASSDNVGVAGYGAYLDGALVGSAGSTTYTFTGLACGTSRTFGIDAYDAAGNRSSRSNVVLQTAACGDTQPPSTPTQLAVSGATQTSVSLSWAASSDNVAVAGYDVYVNTSKVATVTGTSSAVGNLTCNTAYTLGVEAFDAVGNRSARGTVSATTAACSAPPPQLPPTGDLFVSPNGNDAGSCTQLAPCRSLNRAYQVAALGARVNVAAGDYPGQTIVDIPAKDTTGVAPHVVFEGVPGQTRTTGLRLGQSVEDNRGPDHITIRGITGVPGTDLFIGGNDANDILIEDYSARSFYINGAQNLTVKGGTFGPGEAPGTPNSKVDGNVLNSNIVLDGLSIHDYTFGPSCAQRGGTFDCHGEGLFVAGCGSGFVVRNSRFWRNEIYNIFVQPNTPCSATIENNWFGRAQNSDTQSRNTALTFGSNSLSNILVRYNSFASGQRLVDEVNGSFTNVRAIGNIFGTAAACIPGVAYSYNVWTSGACSSTDRNTSTVPYVNPSELADQNYHLLPGLMAEGLVTATGGDYDLATDIDGEPRSTPRDAGSDERG